MSPVGLHVFLEGVLVEEQSALVVVFHVEKIGHCVGFEMRGGFLQSKNMPRSQEEVGNCMAMPSLSAESPTEDADPTMRVSIVAVCGAHGVKSYTTAERNTACWLSSERECRLLTYARETAPCAVEAPTSVLGFTS